MTSQNNQPQNTGKIFTGEVVGDKMKGTIVISLASSYRHPRYHKIIRKHKKIYADNNLNAKTGDLVRVRETRPLSKLKHFTTVEIINKK